MTFSTFSSRVLTLWFDYGHWPDVNEALVEGVKAIQIDTWLQVRLLGCREGEPALAPLSLGVMQRGSRTGPKVKTPYFL